MWFAGPVRFPRDHVVHPNPYLIDEGTEAQRWEGACLKPHRECHMSGQELEPVAQLQLYTNDRFCESNLTVWGDEAFLDWHMGSSREGLMLLLLFLISPCT